MFDFVKSLFMLCFWKNPQAFGNLLEEKREMDQRQLKCDLCGLWGCRHVKEQLKETPKQVLTIIPPAMSIGEPVVDVMESFSSLKPKTPIKIEGAKVSPKASEIEDDDEIVSRTERAYANLLRSPGELHDTLPAGKTIEDGGRRIIIPPNGRLPVIPPPFKVPPFDRTSASTTAQFHDHKNWVDCPICKTRIHLDYLAEHQKVHSHKPEYVSRNTYTNPTGPLPKNIVTPISNVTSTSTAIVKHKDNGIPKLTGPKLKTLENYQFQSLEEVGCLAGSVSNDGRYSDLTVMLWLNNKPSSYSSAYSTYSSVSTMNADNNRLVIHLVYDSQEDYWTVSTKLLKRTSYSSFDNEDSAPERICYQEELENELKRVMLFFCIDPKEAYKSFMNAWNQEFVTEYDEDGRALICQSKNCFDAAERLKPKPYQGTGTGQHQGQYGWHGMGYEYDGMD